MSDDYPGPERRYTPHCENHETNTKDLSRIKGWIAALAIVGTVIGFFGNRYMDSIDVHLTKISTTTDETNKTVNALAILNAVTRAEVEQLKKDVQDLKVHRH
jgi:hypothetical protein